MCDMHHPPPRLLTAVHPTAVFLIPLQRTSQTHNLTLLARLPELVALGFRVVLGGFRDRGPSGPTNRCC